MDEINHVEYFDILGTKVRQNACITDAYGTSRNLVFTISVNL